jgi:rhodanese-related sulfurtransferase
LEFKFIPEEEEMQKITIEDIFNRLAVNQKLTIVDSRSAEAWNKAEEKARGAIRIPPDEAEKHLNDIPGNDYVVTYCT